MSIYKLLALDLDDTLLNSGLQIPERSRRAVQAAMQAGVRVTLATGRMYRSARPYAEQLGIRDYLITYQGALTRHSVTGETLFHRPVLLDLALDVISSVRRYRYHINVYLDDFLYVAERTREGELYAAHSGVPLAAVGDLARFLRERNEDPTKVLVVAPEQRLDELAAEIRPVYGDRLHITKSKPYFLEFSHPDAHKGGSLAAIARHYGMGREEVIAVGDSYNDVEMLEYAGLGVAVGNARPDIIRRADYVCPSNENCGVAEVVEKFIFGRGN
ncbi:MAG: Cof-type HAD-IIB family hydrolase [Firmicutes bacterium]|nr:Cof-type HAD-IIB family hydrolase [Bacillota bacterium]